MTLDLATRADILALQSAFEAVVAKLSAPKPADDEPLWSVQKVAEYTDFDQRTVKLWVEEGRFNLSGKRVYLRAYEYQGRLRFKRADVEDFGLAVGVLTPSVAGSKPEAAKPAAKPKKKRGPVASEQALKVA